MAIQTSNSPPLSVEVIGKAFVEQYYLILHSEPQMAHKFYRHSSVLGRPGPDGTMTSVTTMQGISDKIMSLDNKDYKAEIINVHAQESIMGGVIVGVIGCLFGKDNVRSSFTQTFFLAQQEKGYYILNDFLQFMDLCKPSTLVPVLEEEEEEEEEEEKTPTTPLTQDPDPTHVPDHAVQNHISTAEVSDNGRKVSDQVDIKGSLAEEEVAISKPPVNPSRCDMLPVTELVSDAQKLSYASMVAKESIVTSPDHVPSSVIVRVSPNADQQTRPIAAPKASAPSSYGASQNGNPPAEVKGIYIKYLPWDLSVEQLGGAVKKFGLVKSDGIQIRRFKEDGFCCGFVEFESPNSARIAVEAGKIVFGEFEAIIECKRSSARFATQVGNNRASFSSGRGGFRNENFRGRENYSEGHSKGRYESGSCDDFRGQARGYTGRSGEAYQKVSQNGGGGKGAHQSGTK